MTFRLLLVSILCAGAWAQAGTSSPPPAFKAVNLTESKAADSGMSGMMFMGDYGMMNGGRVAFRSATLLELIESAYDLDRDDRVLGGPTWLGADHFDLRATANPSSSDEQMQAMLQALLTERFGLNIHTDTRPFPGYALVVGKGKPKVKPSAGGDPGCRFNNTGQAAPAGDSTQGATAVSFEYACQNQTMADFASFLQNILSINVQGAGPVVIDSTELKGGYDFAIDFDAPTGHPVLDLAQNIPKIIESQTGLVLQATKVPLSVVVVDGANEHPSGGAAAPLPPPPAEFEVATIKALDPSAVTVGPRGGVMIAGGRGFQVSPGGEVKWNAVSLQQMILFAYNQTPDRLIGAPTWLGQDNWVITAKTSPGLISDDLTGMVQKLLEQRFKLTVHTDKQPVDAYLMTPSGRKVTLKPSGPDERSHCDRSADGTGVQILTCTATTMEQFADQLPDAAPAYFTQHHAADLAGISGAYDFTLRWAAAGILNGGRGGASPAAAGEAATPVQIATTDTIFQAVEKTLGVKVAMGKATLPVLVIDHIERTPTAN